jgi:uncharacterized membrane protein YeaQ/YmgE (transglycosylase-associated protein family)
VSLGAPRGYEHKFALNLQSMTRPRCGSGLLAGLVMKGGGNGVIADIILGILGAFVGGWVFGLLGLGAGGGMIGSIIVAFIGACILIGITRMIKRP